MKQMRTEVNYKKEGFSQIFPILYITNDKEKAWIFGIGKKNIAFVTGENNDYLKNNNEVKSNFIGIGKLDYKQKVILATIFVGMFGMAYYIMKNTKHRR